MTCPSQRTLAHSVSTLCGPGFVRNLLICIPTVSRGLGCHGVPTSQHGKAEPQRGETHLDEMRALARCAPRPSGPGEFGVAIGDGDHPFSQNIHQPVWPMATGPIYTEGSQGTAANIGNQHGRHTPGQDFAHHKNTSLQKNGLKNTNKTLAPSKR